VKVMTRISIKGLSEKEKEKLMRTLEYCHEHDRYGTFDYETDGETYVYIYSPDKETAKKRGYYLKQKFGVFFKSLRQKAM